MKDITKRLEWNQIPDMEPYTGYTATISDILKGAYIILAHVDGFSAVFKTEYQGRIAYPVVDHVATLEEAMVACRQHFNDIVLSMLSEEATQTLLKNDF